MKTMEVTLELQAYVDGELDGRRRVEVERMLAGDAEARAIVEELRQLSRLVQANEPDIRVPETREFYWSQIQRQIASAEVKGTRGSKPGSVGGQWLRWLVPAFGVAALAVMLLPGNTTGGTGAGKGFADLGDPVSLTFHSDTDGITIHWIN